MNRFYSNGKVLLTGEYLVLYGAEAIGLPTKMGQDLLIYDRNDQIIEWNSFNIDKKKWFKCVFENNSLDILKTTNTEISKRLQNLLKIAKRLNPEFLIFGKTVTTNLSFDYRWGLGSSSTLVNNIAQWSKTNPYHLLKKTFGGSGYDIACASRDSPILFSLKSKKEQIKTVKFLPKFKKNLFFVYQNKKQNSKNSIIDFKKKQTIKSSTIDEISDISNNLLISSNIKEFTELISSHERIISELLKLNPLMKMFPDYQGYVKSLGAWGGDFLLAIGPENSLDYFKEKGLKIGFSFDEFIL